MIKLESAQSVNLSRSWRERILQRLTLCNHLCSSCSDSVKHRLHTVCLAAMDPSLNESLALLRFFLFFFHREPLARQLPMWCVLSWQGNCWDLNPPSRPCSPLLCCKCAPAFRNDVNGWWRRTRAHSEVFEDWRLITSPGRQCWYVCPSWGLYSHCIYIWTWNVAVKIKIFLAKISQNTKQRLQVRCFM